MFGLFGGEPTPQERVSKAEQELNAAKQQRESFVNRPVPSGFLGDIDRALTQNPIGQTLGRWQQENLNNDVAQKTQNLAQARLEAAQANNPNWQQNLRNQTQPQNQQFMAQDSQSGFGGINPLSAFTNTGRGAIEGTLAGRNLNADPTYEALRRTGIVLSPEQQGRLSEELARVAGDRQQQYSERQLGVTSGIANQAANANAQRQLALNAQQNAATMAGQQLSALGDRARTTSNTLGQAAQIAASMFR